MRGLLLYSLCLCGYISSIFLLHIFGILYFFLAALLYLFVGIFLSISVLRKIVTWHPVWNTVDNVAREKISHILLWPISYPQLIIKLFINNFL